MQNVFVSYSLDATFVDTLVEDLRFANVAATYDKLIVKPGDSFFEKLGAAVSASDHIIVVLSKSSIRSHWVQAELGLAMASPLFGARAVRVLPALIQQCELPASLSGKSYANFCDSYYSGLRDLLDALCPELYPRVAKFYDSRQRSEDVASGLEAVLSTGDAKATRRWFETHGYALAALFGRLWSVSEAIPQFQISDSSPVSDFLVVIALSYEFLVVSLGNPRLGDVSAEYLDTKVRALRDFVSACDKDRTVFFRCVALRCRDSDAGRCIYPDDDCYRSTAPVKIEGKFICGRRHEFSDRANSFRINTYNSSQGRIEVVSYDRLLEASRKLPQFPPIDE